MEKRGDINPDYTPQPQEPQGAVKQAGGCGRCGCRAGIDRLADSPANRTADAVTAAIVDRLTDDVCSEGRTDR